MTAARRACVLAALGAAAYLLLEPFSADLAAQTYRAGLVHDTGLGGLWNNGWFAGHHTPGYGVLSSPLAALLGVRLAGALAALAATALFAVVAERHWGRQAAGAAALWFALGATAMLLSGRLTFLLGVALALAAVLALQASRPRPATALAVATALASPVAALFLALAALAWGLADRARRVAAAAIAVAALAPIVVFALLFEEGGTEPFVASAFWPALAGVVLVWALLPARERALRLGAAIYAPACVATFALANPLGGNVTRLGALLAGPVVLGALLASGRRNPALLAVVALAFGPWQLGYAVRDVVRASGDPSTAAAYHEPLVRFLQRRPGSFRVEIPLLVNHWEAAHVAPHVALARGWERQLDRRLGALFYDGSLSAASYRAWLDEHAVAYVALPDAPLDYAGRDEADLIRGGLAYLRPVWRNEHWRVFEVRRPTPIVRGAGATVELGDDGFTLRARRAGDVLVRVHHTRWWSVAGGRACVVAGPGGMTRVRVLAAGTVRVRARLARSSCRG